LVVALASSIFAVLLLGGIMSLVRDYIYGKFEAKGRTDKEPITYLIDDITYRCPWFFGCTEPPWDKLFPIVQKIRVRDKRGKLKEILRIDPYTVFIGVTEGEQPFGYNPRYVVNPLVLIVGTPGAGKSASVHTIIYNFIKTMLACEHLHETTIRQPTVLVADPEGEYEKLRDMIGRPEETLVLKLGVKHFINIFDRPSKTINPLNWYMRILPVIQKFMNLSETQAPRAFRVLIRVITELLKDKHVSPNDPRTWFVEDITLADIYQKIETEYLQKYENASEKLTRRERILYEGAQTLSYRLASWMKPPNDAFSKRSSIDLTNVFKYRLVIFDLRHISSRALQGLFSYWITMWVYGLLLERGPLPEFGIRIALIVDEAWALLREGGKNETNPLEELARRGRKYGIWLVVATQTVKDVSDKMFSLFGTLAVGRLPAKDMVDKVVRSRGMPQKFASKILGLAQGEFVWSMIWRRNDFPNARMPVKVFTQYVIPPLVDVEV